MAVMAVDAGVRAEQLGDAGAEAERRGLAAPPRQRREGVGPVGLGRPQAVEAERLGGPDLLDGVGRRAGVVPVADDQSGASAGGLLARSRGRERVLPW